MLTAHVHLVGYDLQRLTLDELGAGGVQVMVDLGLTNYAGFPLIYDILYHMVK
jgi:hypothetical protein